MAESPPSEGWFKFKSVLNSMKKGAGWGAAIGGGAGLAATTAIGMTALSATGSAVGGLAGNPVTGPILGLLGIFGAGAAINDPSLIAQTGAAAGGTALKAMGAVALPLAGGGALIGGALGAVVGLFRADPEKDYAEAVAKQQREAQLKLVQQQQAMQQQIAMQQALYQQKMQELKQRQMLGLASTSTSMGAPMLPQQMSPFPAGMQPPAVSGQGRGNGEMG